MRQLKLLFTTFFMISSGTIFAIGNNEEQVSSTLVVKNSDAIVESFTLIRESIVGSEIINIVGESQNSYTLSVVDASSIPAIQSTQFTCELWGSDTKIDIENFSAYSANSSYLESLNSEPDYINRNYTYETISVGVRLISNHQPENSYQFLLKINPSVIINIQDLESDEEIIETIEENPDIKRYIKHQFMGSTSFDSNSENPFPLANIDNNYIYKTSSIEESGRVVAQNMALKHNLDLFGAIYQEESIVNKILTVYFNKNKPLFHHYINEYMEEQFNYDQYSKISAAEGQELVDNALKYLTWGLEYTPSYNKRELSTTSNSYPSQLLNENHLVSWLSPHTNNNREDNYLPEDPTITPLLVNPLDPTFSEIEVQNLQTLSMEHQHYLNLNTPFFTNNSVITGSALPYVKGGVDSPRTFNYKILQQKKLIDRVFNREHFLTYGKQIGDSWVVNNHLYSFRSNGSTVSNIEDYYFFYGDDYTDLEIDEPFFPGLIDDKVYSKSNLTGVDSLGMLSGSLAMTSFYRNILGVLNDNKTGELDNYYRFENETDLPDFNSNPSSVENIRLTREDLERTTVIVPNLESMQPGDLLVKGRGDDTVVAIVIKPSTDIEKTLVLTVTDELERVSIGYWGSGGLLAEPKNFLVRRLIKFTGDIDESHYDITTFENEEDDKTWDAIIPTNDPLTAKLDIESNSNNGNLIPNTGELFQINSIQFGEADGSTFKECLDYNGADVIISSPTDMNYDTTGNDNNSSSTGSNIFVNKGDGFALYAIKNSKDLLGNEYLDAIRLATFRLNSFSTNKFDRYNTEYSDIIFTDDGFCLSGYSLTYSQGSGVLFTIGDNNRFTKFAIRPLESNIRPGDDLLLNFELYKDNQTTPVHTRPEDFLAVYDEKLLWRANLYIDTKDNNDWNNINPWNAPNSSSSADSYGAFEDNGVTKRFFEPIDSSFSYGNRRYYNSSNLKLSNNTDRVWYGENEWNRYYDGVTRLDRNKIEPEEADYLETLDRGDGRQVVSLSNYDYIPSIVGGDAESNNTAYAYGCSDSPFEFNDELRQQQILFNNIKSRKGDIFKRPRDQWPTGGIKSFEQYTQYITDYLFSEEDYDDGKDLIKLDEYTETTARVGVYDNYIHPSETIDKLPLEDSDSFNNPSTSLFSRDKNFPFLPGWALEYYFSVSKSVPNWMNAISAGVDCLGFVTRSASYVGKNYSWGTNRNQRVTVKSDWFTAPTYPYYKGATGSTNEWSYKISNKVTIGSSKNLDKIRPGDLMYYHDSNGRGQHIAIVQAVEYSEGMGLEDIKLIESTWYGKISNKIYKNAKVTNTKTLKDYEIYSWVIVRPV